ncbi:MFS transporter [Alkalicoccobacillus porphyridii]|uniref:MFS transporter n=1 Tax=Alkalicoccobacillus porphyridii TaxID=2597270 RepID=A0A554A113_9BACI|nr:MFS transporter [Alkalicoccobacillus porphyridii]TSB47381.1 MFS transporter [Alkalicoccobacillus porphyridii]
MGERKKEEWLFISICCGLYWFAHSLTRPVIALYGLSFGASELQIGLILAIYAVVPLLLAIPIGGYIKKVGAEVLFRWGAWLMCISAILYLLSMEVSILIVAQIVAGIGQLFVWLTVQVMITGEAAKPSKAKRIATFSFYMALGQLLGPVTAGFSLEWAGYFSVFLLYGVICVVIMFAGYRIQKIHVDKESAVQPERRTPAFALVRNKGVAAGLVASFVMLFIVDTRMSYVPLYLEVNDFNYLQIGILLTIASAAGLLVKAVYERLTKVWSMSTILMWSFFFSMLLLMVVPITQNIILISAVLAVSGFSLAINQSVSMSLISEHTTSQERGTAFGLRLLMNRAAQLLNPMYFSLVLPFLSYTLSFLLLGLILSVFALFTVNLLKRVGKQDDNVVQVDV